MGDVNSIVKKIKQKKEKEVVEEPKPTPEEKQDVPEEDEEYYEEGEDETLYDEETSDEEEEAEEEVKTNPEGKPLSANDEIMLLRDDGIYRQAMLLEMKQINASLVVLNSLIQKAIGTENDEGEGKD